MRYDRKEIRIPGIHLSKNLESRYTHVSEEYAQHMGYKSSKDFMRYGGTDYDLRCKAVELADTFVYLDKQTLKDQKIIKMIDYACYAKDTWLLLVSQKTPIYEDNQISGISYTAIDFTKTSLRKHCLSIIDSNKIFNKEKQFSYILKENIDESLFSKRESECLYFILRGKACSQIASVLKIDRRTVEVYANNLKNKLKVFNKSQLIEKALSLGYYYIIPESVISYL